jgi:polar amino acid transport system permease protein/cystine transport system permease protein
LTDAASLSRLAALLPDILRTLLWGAGATLMLTAASFALAATLGFVLALMRRSDWLPVRAVARAYLELFRNVPILTQLFILYFGLARIGITLPATVAAILGFGLNGAAILSEVFRSSINAVDRGQHEAALAIGMTPGRSFRSIILPQAFPIALPSTGSFLIGLLKDTSLASAAAVPELAFRARMLVSETYLTTEIYLTVAVIYLFLSLPIARFVRWAERRSVPHRAT